MKIYIASSWKNQHGVELLTEALRKQGHEVVSWIENCYGEQATLENFDFNKWVNTPKGQQSFDFDINGATLCDLLIYYGPAGKDACCEMGAAWSAGVPIIALYAKGEDLGLMRKMVCKWFEKVHDLLEYTKDGVHAELREHIKERYGKYAAVLIP